jgi:uncharacterized protein involved in exopolysaccharide biosynthesis
MNNEFLNSIHVVRRRAWLIGLLVIVTVATILYLGYTAPPSYQARVRLRVLAVESEAVTLFAPSSSLPGREQIINTREEFFSFLRGRNVAWQTIGDLGLTMDADTLQQRMTFEEQDDFVSVVATAERPDLAEKIATTYVNYALLAYREFRLSPVNQSAQFIDTQLADERQKLNTAQDAFLKFKLANAIESLPTEIQALQGELRRLRLDRDQAVIDEQQAQATLDLYQAAADQAQAQALALLAPTPNPRAPRPTATPLPAGAAATPDLGAALSADARQQWARTYQDEALRYQSLVTEQRVRIQQARASQARYDQMIAQRETEMSSLIGLHTEYDNHEATVKQAADSVAFLADKAAEAHLRESQGLNSGFLQIIEPARIPTDPTPSQTARLALVGAVLAFLAGIVLAFVLEFLGAARQDSPASRRSDPRTSGQ